MGVAFISHYDCTRHEMGEHHPEDPKRLHAINDRFVASGLDMVLYQFDAPLAEKKQLLLAHDADYVESVFQSSPEEGLAWLDGDTAMNKHTLQAALRSVGGAMLGVDLLMEGKVKQVFCATRPPGHHAERHRAMGFCFFNNIAIAAYHAIEVHGLQRVAIVDFDVHHGNGTEDIVSGDERILFCSSFQHPYYPGSGADTDVPNIVNVPLPKLTDGAGFREAMIDKVLPRIREFEPELILISAGFDAHRADDMAGLNLLEFDYAWMTKELLAIAERTAEGRILSALEGGYELHSLARSVEAHVKAFY